MILARVRRTLRERALLSRGERVLVACSGGPDSAALLHVLRRLAPSLELDLHAASVDHGVRPDAAREVELAGALAASLRVPFTPLAITVPREGASAQAKARVARYAALFEHAARVGASALAVGHTLDDQAETVLLGLARGSGARSLSGMAPRRGLWRRPLLAVRRTTTEAACAALGLQPWSDPTNDPASVPHGQEAPLRSRVRHDVLPVLTSVLGPGVPEALARTAELLRDDADVLDLLAADLLERARDGTGPGDPTGLDVEVLADAPDALRRRALREAIVAAGSPAGSVHRVHVEAVDALLTRWTGQGPITLPGGVRASRTYGRLTFVTATS